MADASGPVAVPEAVRLPANTVPRFTPNQIRALKAETGRSFTELMDGENGDGDDGDRWQLMVWLQLRRQGLLVSWADCANVGIDVDTDEAEPDPTSGGPSTSSPPSAGSGG